MMDEVQIESMRKSLIHSEYSYFSAGSHNRKMLSGTISVTPKYESLASGCVLYDIQEKHINIKHENWLCDVENEFKKNNALLCRIYLPQNINMNDDFLIDRGYQKVIEVGLTVSLKDILNIPHHTQGYLEPIEDHTGWFHKRNLYIQSILGPDGHDMQNGAFAELEKIKCDAKYMVSYLYWKENQPVGAVSLAIDDGFARLKNLLVHPNYRDKGVGREIVINLMHEAVKKGAKDFGVYAVENMNSHKLYLKCGMQEVLKHTEWTKEL